MKKIITVGLALTLLSACSDKSSKANREDQITGTFVVEEVVDTRNSVDMGTRAAIQKTSGDKYNRQVVVQIQDGKYHRYEVLGVEGAQKQTLSEKVYDYKMQEDGSLELTLVEDTCGVTSSDEKIILPKASDTNLKEQTGQTLERVSKDDGAEIIAKINEAKANGTYDKDCSQTWRDVSNSVTSFVGGVWSTINNSFKQGAKNLSDPNSAISRRAN